MPGVVPTLEQDRAQGVARQPQAAGQEPRPTEQCTPARAALLWQACRRVEQAHGFGKRGGIDHRRRPVPPAEQLPEQLREHVVAHHRGRCVGLPREVGQHAAAHFDAPWCPVGVLVQGVVQRGDQQRVQAVGEQKAAGEWIAAQVPQLRAGTFPGGLVRIGLCIGEQRKHVRWVHDAVAKHLLQQRIVVIIIANWRHRWGGCSA